MDKQSAIGVYYGEVVDVIDPLKLGRIRVRTPHYIGAPSSSIPWASYGNAGGGGSHNTGFYFIPDVGAQVLVAFVQGSVEHPVWLGGVPGNDPETGKPDTHVSTLDENSPYGQPIENWDHTLFRSITTTAGHRIVLDDNIPRNEAREEVNSRRILLESAAGHFFRMIEAKTLVAGQEDALIELATVDELGGWVRRVALDDEDRNITITGPDRDDDGQHEIEINSEDDYISITTSREYTFLMDDQNELIDLHTSRPGDQIGNQLIFTNQDKSINLKSFEDQSGMTIVDGPSGYVDFYMPHGVEQQNTYATIGIQHNQGSPQAYMTTGSGLAQNGFNARANGSSSVMWSGGPLGSANPGPGGNGPAQVAVVGGQQRYVYAGIPGSYINLSGQEATMMNTSEVNLLSTQINLLTSSGGQVVLSADVIMMTRGSGIGHDYFLHTHAIDAAGLLARQPHPGIVTGSIMLSPSGGGPIIGSVISSYPGP